MNTPERSLALHALMVGLTPLIPIPFVDDLARGLLTRRMLESLARAREVPLDEAALDELARDETGGCGLGGCAGGCLLMPFRRILRKVLIFLEWKRATDLVARAWLYGSLVDLLLERGWRPGESGPTPARVRLAAEAAMAAVGTSPVEQAVRTSIDRARGTMEAGAALLQKALGRRRRREDVAEAVDTVEAQEEEQLESLAERLQAALSAVPEGWFRNLRSRFEAELDAGEPDAAPPLAEAGPDRAPAMANEDGAGPAPPSCPGTPED